MPDNQPTDLEAEVVRLSTAYSQETDRVDRLEEALHRIASWADAYPLAVFPEPDFKKAQAVLEAAGMTLDAISASAMRHVITQVGHIAKGALGQ